MWGATTFHLAAPVTLSAPNGGEDWTSGQVHTITWTPGVGDVKLEASRDGGPFTTIVAATPNDGSYDWTVTGPASSQVVVRVTALSFTGSDVSDAPFTVTVPPGDATAPTTTVSGVDTLWHRTPVTLTFTATDTESGVMRTEYAIDGGCRRRAARRSSRARASTASPTTRSTTPATSRRRTTPAP